MASASVAIKAPRLYDIDLRPYGINLTLTAKLTYAEYEDTLKVPENVRYVVTTDDSYPPDVLTFTSEKDTIRYNLIDKRINKGQYGSVSAYFDPSGNKVAIKKIKFNEHHPIDFQIRSFLNECIIQIILAETARQYHKVNFGVPVLYKIGMSSDRNYGFIVSELMEWDSYSLIMRNSHKENDITVPDMLLQIADILDFFQTTLQFNHRDLKTDNIMLEMVDGRPIYKLIDFGKSCLKLDNFSVESRSYTSKYTMCFRRGRDLAQLIYEFTGFPRNLSDKLRRWLHGLNLAPDGTDWFISKELFNIASSPARPQQIVNHIQKFQASIRNAPPQKGRGSYKRKRKNRKTHKYSRKR